MPGKISVTRQLTIDVTPFNDLQINLDGTTVEHLHGHFTIEDDSKEHTLTFSEPIDNLYIENISVIHLMVENTLTFTTPIYKWLFANIDNK